LMKWIGHVVNGKPRMTISRWLNRIRKQREVTT